MDLIEVGDRLEIQEMYARYVHAVDVGDYETLEAHVFMPDATFDYSLAGGPVVDWAGLREIDMFSGNGCKHIFHITSNLVIDFDATREAASCMSKTFNAWAWDLDEDHRTYQIHGTYRDRVVKSERGWRIASRHWTEDWVSGWQGEGFRITAKMTEVGSI